MARLQFHSVRRQSGAGIVETMVGILIGLLVVLVVYNMLAVAEGYKRTTAGVSDAQITGLLSQFMAGRDAGNGGNGISLAAPDLINCTRRGDNTQLRALPITAPERAMRPTPVLITDGGADNVSDSFISLHSGAPHVLWSIAFMVDAAANEDFTVQSPNGFSTPAGVSLPTGAQPYWIVAMANDGTGLCELVQVTAATKPDAVSGNTTLTHTASAVSYNRDFAKMVILGRDGQANRLQYDVGKDQLRTTDLLNGAAPNPVAQNVVLLKAQYGIDLNNDSIIDCWTAADNKNACGDGKNYTDISDPGNPPDAAKLFPTVDELNRIIAVRVAMVVRSEQSDPRDPSLFVPANTTIEGANGVRQDLYLFNCAANDNTCTGRIKVPAGNNKTDVLQDGWRYRAYETIIPIRNTIYNSTL